MSQEIINAFTEDDKKINSQLDVLFTEWYEFLKKNDFFQKTKTSPDCFIQDGIFPRYSEQKVKILYMGRESYDLEGFNYIYQHYDWLKSKALNGSTLWRKMLRFTWGLENNTADWADVPSLDEILNNFASDDGISFGMINYSKISRPHNGTTKADWQQIINFAKASLESPKNFYIRQLEIINPDVIISMNVFDAFDDVCLDVFEGALKYISHTNNKSAALFEFMLNNRKIPVIDTYHLGSTISDKEHYESIQEAMNIFLKSYKR